MVGSFLGFIKSLEYRSNVRTLSLAKLDQQASPFCSPTQIWNQNRAPLNLMQRASGDYPNATPNAPSSPGPGLSL